MDEKVVGLILGPESCGIAAARMTRRFAARVFEAHAGLMPGACVDALKPGDFWHVQHDRDSHMHAYQMPMIVACTCSGTSSPDCSVQASFQAVLVTRQQPACW